MAESGMTAFETETVATDFAGAERYRRSYIYVQAFHSRALRLGPDRRSYSERVAGNMAASMPLPVQSGEWEVDDAEIPASDRAEGARRRTGSHQRRPVRL